MKITWAEGTRSGARIHPVEILICWHGVWTELESFEGSLGTSNVQPSLLTSGPRELPTVLPIYILISFLGFSEFEDQGVYLEDQLKTHEGVLLKVIHIHCRKRRKFRETKRR